MMRILPRLAGALAALLIAATAAAQIAPRKIPANTLRGIYTAAPFPGAYIDGKLMQMAPGVRIVTPSNRTIPPAQVPPDTPVRYELDAEGKIRMVWMLTPEEARGR
jgi:hypothetical protein